MRDCNRDRFLPPDDSDFCTVWDGRFDIDETFCVNGVWYRMSGELEASSPSMIDMYPLKFERLDIHGLWIDASEEISEGGPACDEAWNIAEKVWHISYDECDYHPGEYYEDDYDPYDKY